MLSGLWLALLLPVSEFGADADPAVPLPPLTVAARALPAASAVATEIPEAVIEQRGAHHPQELFTTVPGAWISRGSGQEHLTAIRSPVLTGAGACGAFLVLEDHIPIRPAGFCNVNNLFEVNLRQASAVSVLRGPGLSQHGANALHGVIDIASPRARSNQAFFEGGSPDYRRFGLQAGIGGNQDRWQLAANHVSSGSFRIDESYRHTQINLRHETRWRGFEVESTLAAVDLDQQTAGFIIGEDAYRDEVLRRRNANPEAFRDAYALRAASHWQWRGDDGAAYRLSPYARHSEMEFLQHFLPGQPLEYNRQSSAGLQFTLAGPAWAPDLVLGAEGEWLHGRLREFQPDPITEGSAFLRETRPAGLHYDYRIGGLNAATWARYDWSWADRWQLSAGLRAEWQYYDYDNRMLDGNSRDDGTACGFGGCLFSRPADRDDEYFNLTPSLTLNAPAGAASNWQLRYARGFRPPQAVELYRLQRGQQVADLKSETLDSWSLSLAGSTSGGMSLEYALTAFYQFKRDVILRDADGFNISDGKTRHYGLEWDLQLDLNPRWRLHAVGTWAQHEYRFDRELGQGEVITRGNQIDTAPRHLGSVSLQWRPRSGSQLSLRGEYLSAYPLDAANSAEYEGHALLHAEARLAMGEQWYTQVRLRNLFDRRYAERADFAFGNFRYFPGQGRTLLIELGWRQSN